MNDAGTKGRSYERTDVSFRAVAATGAALLGLLLLLSAILWFASRSSLGNLSPPAPFPAVSVALRPDEAPVLQVTPKSDLARLRARETALIDSYGWIDRERGIAHIPIERAMEILAEKKPPADRDRDSNSREQREP